jgi:hypothetical protein
VNKESKKGFGGLFIDEEDVTMITWTLAMQKVGLFINLQQLKLKVGKLIQTKPIQSRNGVFKNSYPYWFKHRHLEFNIC